MQPEALEVPENGQKGVKAGDLMKMYRVSKDLEVSTDAGSAGDGKTRSKEQLVYDILFIE